MAKIRWTEEAVTIETNPFRMTPRIYRKIFTAEICKRRKWLLRVILSIAVLSIVMTLACIFMLRDFAAVSSWFPFIVIMLSWYGMTRFGIPWIHTRSGKNKHVFTTYTYKITEDEIVMHSESGRESKIPLPQIVKISKVIDYYLLYTDAINAEIIPESSFKSPSELEAFKEIIGKTKDQNSLK